MHGSFSVPVPEVDERCSCSRRYRRTLLCAEIDACRDHHAAGGASHKKAKAAMQLIHCARILPIRIGAEEDGWRPFQFPMLGMFRVSSGVLPACWWLLIVTKRYAILARDLRCNRFSPPVVGGFVTADVQTGYTSGNSHVANWMLVEGFSCQPLHQRQMFWDNAFCLSGCVRLLGVHKFCLALLRPP